MPVLVQLVARLESYPPHERSAFAQALAQAASEPSVPEIPIRHPLFDRIVLPVLVDRYDRNEVGSARVLLHFFHQIHGGRLCKDVIGERELSQGALLERAILQEPGARDLQLQWLDMARGWFEYATHEVPAGVLHGNDGATVAGCDDLLEQVDRFAARAATLGVAEQNQDSIAEWRYHVSGDRAYLLDRRRHGSFEQFLADHPPRPC